MKFFNIGIINRTFLQSALLSTDLTVTVTSGTAIDFPDPPFLAAISAGRSLVDLNEAEFVEITDVAGDVFTFGDRDLYGQAVSQDWDAGSQFLEVWQPNHINSVVDSVLSLSRAICMAISNVATGVKTLGPDFNQLQVVQQASPNMTVLVKQGLGFSDYRLASLTSDVTSDVIVAPGTLPRIDLISLDTITDTIVVTTGVEGGSAPATPSNNIPLATIALTVGQTTITTGAITDVRVQL